ncbi:nitrate/nitrite transporter NrtS [Desertivirga brevis]|uniref:nitrate/nitrite transporter NrtS n=1 Tax=Desertivirga brevis TaxID=2810310 RepID=UPI001A96DD4E
MGAFKEVFSKSTCKKGILLALFVGSILNLINQGNFLVNHQWQQINLGKVLLTYLTPFFVCVYSTATARKRQS